MGTLNTPDTSRFTGVENELQKEAQKKSPTQESGTNTANIATETMYNPDVKQASIEELVEKANLLSTANNNINSSLNDPNATPEEVALLKDFQSNKLPTLSNLEISNLNQKCKIQVAGPWIALGAVVICAVIIGGAFYINKPNPKKDAENLAKAQKEAEKILASENSKQLNWYTGSKEDILSDTGVISAGNDYINTITRTTSAGLNPNKETLKIKEGAYREALQKAITNKTE